jgi:Cu+-exporting ATPase
VKVIAKQSAHPLSKNIFSSLQNIPDKNLSIRAFNEYTGKGVEAVVDDLDIKIGSFAFINQNKKNIETHDTGTHVHIAVNDVHMGRYTISNQYRDGLHQLINRLKQFRYKLFVLSGDNNTEKNNLLKMFGKDADIQFHQSPQQKLQYIQQLQKDNDKVLMLGDGLNDAGALMQSDVGIAVSDNNAQFSPACDAILNGENVQMLDKFLAYARSGKNLVTASFILSILYNIVGLSFAVQAQLSPMVAAILMPASSISIVLLVTLLSSVIAKQKGLQ